MTTADGFPGQRLRVLSDAAVRAAREDAVTARLVVTDAGWFPIARTHGRRRPDGARQAIILVCVDGRGWIETDGQRREVAAASAVVIPRDVPHDYGADAHDPWSIWWLHVDGSDVAALVHATAAAVVPLRDASAVVALAQQVVQAMERDETRASRHDAAGAAWHLLARLEAERSRGPVASDPVVDAQAHLRETLAQSHAVPVLARRAGLSASHFAARFRAATGMGVMQYLTSLRIARACELLLTTDAAIAEVGAEVGYDDPYHFSRRFRSVMNQSPTEFRNAARSDVV